MVHSKQSTRMSPILEEFLERLPLSSACGQVDEALEYYNESQKKVTTLICYCSAVVAITLLLALMIFFCWQQSAIHNLNSSRVIPKTEQVGILGAEYMYSSNSESEWLPMAESQSIFAPLIGTLLVRYKTLDGYTEPVEITPFSNVIAPSGNLKVKLKVDPQDNLMQAKIEDFVKKISISKDFTRIGEVYVESGNSLCVDVLYYNWQGTFSGLKSALKDMDNFGVFKSMAMK